LNFALIMASLIVCRVHPVVLLSVIDAYERRDSKDGSNKKAIGTLLGGYDKGVVEVTNCYCVPHSEVNEEAKISTAINKEMYELSRISNSVEVAVGWFSTNADINDTSLLYHDFYQDFVKSVSGTREQAGPVVHLTVDTSLTTGRMGLKAYVLHKVKIPKTEQNHCAIFIPVDVDIVAFEPEKVGVSTIMLGKDNPKRLIQLYSGVDQIRKASDQMLTWIDKLRRYVDDVLSGKRPSDSNVGRKLSELVTSVTQLQPGQFENMLNSGMKDFLMVAYLAELAKTQLKLHEKLVSL